MNIFRALIYLQMPCTVVPDKRTLRLKFGLHDRKCTLKTEFISGKLQVCFLDKASTNVITFYKLQQSYKKGIGSSQLMYLVHCVVYSLKTLLNQLTLTILPQMKISIIFTHLIVKLCQLLFSNEIKISENFLGLNKFCCGIRIGSKKI